MLSSPEKPLVLVVEDEVDIRETLVELFEEKGFAAIGAANGAVAIGILRSTARIPSAIVLDMMMPVMDGRAFREHQRANPAWAAIPVVLVSAHHEAARHAAELGVEFLAKPCKAAHLLAMIRQMTGR